MPERKAAAAASKRPRDKYSRLICLACQDRRIRCELPSDAEIPNPGELRSAQTPCYRCKRRGVPCIIRQTILGRPAAVRTSTAALGSGAKMTGDLVPRVIIELPLRPASTQSTAVRDEAPRVDGPVLPWTESTTPLLIHKPQSPETVILIHALDTIRYERVEEEWFRHLPAYVGHTRALDLSIKAIVAACAYARGVPKLTPGDCHQALALALAAVQAELKQPHSNINDGMLAATALLAPHEGIIKKHGIPTRLHVQGMAAILAARSATFSATPLARGILSWYACESFIAACVQGTPSPFEGVPRDYFANDSRGRGDNNSDSDSDSDSDRNRLEALGIELWIRLPRLVSLVRSLRQQPSPQARFASYALELLKSLLELQDAEAEARLLSQTECHPSGGPEATLSVLPNLRLASTKDFEALACYWHTRLSLLRLEWRLCNLSLPNDCEARYTQNPRHPSCLTSWSRANEMCRLVMNILMFLEYAGTLPLHKHSRLLAQLVVAAWGATIDAPATTTYQTYEKITGLPLSGLLLHTINVALSAKPSLTANDMDTAADVFVGGELKGRFAERFAELHGCSI